MNVTETARELPPRRTSFAILLNVLGMIVVAAYLLPQLFGGTIVLPQWTVPVPFAFGAVAAWIVMISVPPRLLAVSRACCLVMVVAGATAAWPTNGLLIVPVIAGILQISALEHPTWLPYAYALAAGGLVLVVPLIEAVGGGKGVTPEGILSLEFAVLVALLGGANRRQARARQVAAAELAERTVAMREEQAKASALTARQSLARDMHDVLAHSLGGLVIQLDAVEAQLEAGKTDAALGRLHDARSMAASGLAEARRAVEALRSPTDASVSVPPADLAAQLIDLVDAHERLGGRIDFEQLGTPIDVPDAVATALRRALQESLSNARKHAPGEPVTVRLDWGRARVRLTVTNPDPAASASSGGPYVLPDATQGSAVSAERAARHVSEGAARDDNTAVPDGASESVTRAVDLAATGGGRGLVGMRERFSDLAGGAVQVGRRDGLFTVRAEAALSDGRGGER
jgi:signal transduction histidine kinase